MNFSTFKIKILSHKLCAQKDGSGKLGHKYSLPLTTSISQFYQIHQHNVHVHVRIVQFETALVMNFDSPGNHKGLAMPLPTDNNS